MARIKLKINAMSFHTVGIAGSNTHIVSVRVGLGAEEGKEVRLDVTREDPLCSFLVDIDNKGQRLASDEGSNTARPSSKVFSRSTASPSILCSAATSALEVMATGMSSMLEAAAR